MNDFANSFSSVSDSVANNITAASKAMQDLSKEAGVYEDRLQSLKKASKDMSKPEEYRRRALLLQQKTTEKLNTTEKVRSQTEKKLQKDLGITNEKTKKFGEKTQKTSDLTFKNVAANNDAMRKEFAVTGKTTSAVTGQISTDFRSIEQENMGQEIAAGFNLATKSFDNFGPEMGAMVGDVAGEVLGEVGAMFGPIGAIIGEVLGKIVGKAVEQMAELNKAIVQLGRDTGGMVNAAMLGSSEFGNIKGTFGSLQAAVIGANLNMKEFTEAIQNLMSDGMGAVAGAAKIGAGDLKEYGLEAARFSKMYGADISGSVRNMFMDFRKPIGEITSSIDNASMRIQAAGLSVKEFVKNLEAVTELSGEVYFKDGIEGMERMAETATRLGTSVSSLTDGLSSLNSLTDLYTQQQKSAAMGMHSLGRNMAKVFALKQAGKSGEAANLRLSSAAHDLSQFMDNQGKVSQQGIATAQGMGMSADDVKNIERLTAGAKNAGLSMEQFIGPPEDLTDAQKKAREQEEANSRTLGERWNIATQTFMQAFIDPIANLFEPVLKSLMSAFEGIMSVLSIVGRMVMSALVVPFKGIAGFFSAIFENFGEVFSELGDKLGRLWKALEPAFSAVGDAFSWIGYLLGKAFGIPLKIIGASIGGVIDIFSWLIESVGEFIGWISEGLQPVFDWLGKAVDVIGDGLSWLWDKLSDVFKPIIDWFKQLTDAVKKVYNWFANWFGTSDKKEVVSDSEAVQSMTNKELAKQPSSPVAPTQSLDAGASMTQGMEAAKKDQALTSGEQAVQGMTKDAVKGGVTNVSVKAGLMGKNEVKTSVTNGG